jgi:hypothetical protein
VRLNDWEQEHVSDCRRVPARRRRQSSRSTSVPLVLHSRSATGGMVAFWRLAPPKMMRMALFRPLFSVLVFLLVASTAPASAQSGRLEGRVTDMTGGVLPGTTVEALPPSGAIIVAISDAAGRYEFDVLSPGRYRVSFRLPNFTTLVKPNVAVEAHARKELDVTLQLTMSASVVVTGKATFTNLADVEDPSASLLGVADAATQGAITAKQLDSRPLMRVGEVLETVPGLVISQHSGEGKANQYYLRGFNLDHGTDFATTVAGMPVNMPTHAHGQGYSDLSFLVPELVSGVQFRKGPYFAEDGDFSSAGSATINYVNALDRPLVRLSVGQEGWSRVVAAVSPPVRDARLLTAIEIAHDDGPWTRPDAFRKVNGVVRYSRGDAVNGLALTGMAYEGRWHSTDQVPVRAIREGFISRFGNVDPTDGGTASRYSGSVDWQRARGSAAINATAYAIESRLDLFSNFTYFLDDPVHGDQFEQADRRGTTGGRINYRRLGQWQGRAIETTGGMQLRNDDIGLVGLYHTESRSRLGAIREDHVRETSAGLYAQNAVQWSDRLRTVLGVRADGYRFDDRSDRAANSGTRIDALMSPKLAVVAGPWLKTEFYANAGNGFHSNDARGATITVDPQSGESVAPVTPLVRAHGAEIGIRSIIVPRWQTTLALWRLGLASELVFAGDAGTTEVGRPSLRKGIEWANYFSPRSGITCDLDVSVSSARFTDADPAGHDVPGALDRVVSAGIAAEGLRGFFGSVRLRYFGPRPLIEDGSVRSQASTTLNADIGRQFSGHARLTLAVFNVLNADVSDIDYYYRSRLRGEPETGASDVHTHPALPRSARVALALTF